MKALVDTSQLAAACAAAARIIPSKSPHPTAMCLLLEADASGSCHVTANNFTLQVTYSMPAEVRRPGSICVRAALFAEYLGELRGASERTFLATNVGGEILHVLAGRFRARVWTIAGDTFLPLRPGTPAVDITLEAGGLRQALAETAFAVAQHAPPDDALGNLIVEVHDGRLSVAAMDGSRIAMTSATARSTSPDEVTLRIPRKAADELSFALSRVDSETEVRLLSDYYGLEVLLEGGRLITQLGSGRVPEYRLRLEDEPVARASISRQTLHRVVSRFAHEGRAPRLTLRWLEAPDGLEVSAEHEMPLFDGQTVRSNAAVVLDATTSGESARVEVNGKHLAETLAALHDDEVELSVGSVELHVKDSSSARHDLLTLAIQSELARMTEAA